MPTKTYIESSLKSINDSDFQNLIIRFLMFRGYEFVTAPGAMDSKNKTTKGTPDALFHGLDRNKYVLCEITTKNKKDNKKNSLINLKRILIIVLTMKKQTLKILKLMKLF